MSFAALKDGKLYDEATGLVAPWMRQPDEFGNSDYSSTMDSRAYSGNGSHLNSQQYMQPNYHNSVTGSKSKAYNPSAVATNGQPFDMMGGGANPSKYSSRHDPPAVATYTSQSRFVGQPGLPGRVTSLDVLYSLDDGTANGVHQQQQQQHDFISREPSDMTLNSFIGWPSMTSLLNSDEPSNLVDKPNHRPLMSALSSAVLNELQHMTSHNSIPQTNNDMDTSSGRNKRSHEGSQDLNNSVKRQVTLSTQQGNDVIVKREKTEPSYDDVGYSLEDDHAWSLPSNNHNRPISDSSSSSSAGASSMNQTANSSHGHKPRSTTSSTQRPKPITHHEPIMPSNHSSIELIGAAVSSSFYQPISSANVNPPKTSTATLANNAATMAVNTTTSSAASSVQSTPASSQTVSSTMVPTANASKPKSFSQNPREKAIPHNSSVENFW